MILVSACLAGINCRYDGKSQSVQEIIDLVKNAEAIPVCPELLGGLGVPRKRCEKRGDKIITEIGDDVTNNFMVGAYEALKIAKSKKCKLAILKSKSPSCGCGLIYDGTFRGILTKGDGILTKGDGILTKLLKENGIKVITENGI